MKVEGRGGSEAEVLAVRRQYRRNRTPTHRLLTRDRAILDLSFRDDWTVPEIAEAFGLSESYVYRVLASLRSIGGRASAHARTP